MTGRARLLAWAGALVFAGALTGLGLLFALLNIVGVEFLINTGGLGQLVNELSERYDLAGMYAASFGDFGLLWYLALVASVIGIFYLSIINQNKKLLGTASFFMVLTVITLSFRYFSGYGATTSLILATIGLLGTAAIASSINKKYFK